MKGEQAGQQKEGREATKKKKKGGGGRGRFFFFFRHNEKKKEEGEGRATEENGGMGKEGRNLGGQGRYVERRTFGLRDAIIKVRFRDATIKLLYI